MSTKWTATYHIWHKGELIVTEDINETKDGKYINSFMVVTNNQDDYKDFYIGKNPVVTSGRLIWWSAIWEEELPREFLMALTLRGTI